ncbi:MAG: chloride channel protein [Rickettsiales bacterium]
MNINKINKKIFYFYDFFIKNSVKIFFTPAFIFFISIFLSLGVLVYCELFYKFSEIAKDRVVSEIYLSMILTPTLFWLSTYIHKKYAYNPYGAGLDSVTFSLKKLQKKPNDYQKVSNFIGLKVAIAIIFSSLISTYAGGSLGREAPSIVISVCVVFSLAYYLKKYLLNFELETWIYMGYAIGIGIAFNAPFSGLIYIIEKVIKNKSKYYFKALLLSCIALTLLSALMINHGPIYFINNFYGLQNNDFYHYLLITIYCATLAYLLLKITKFFYLKFIVLNGIKWHFVPIIFGLIVALIGINFGIYSIGGGIRSVNDALQNNDIIHGQQQLIGRYLSTIFTYISGNAGGLVAPSIALGNLVGAVYSLFYEIANFKTMMIIGMVAFLSPVLGTPITSALVIIESTEIGVENIFMLITISTISFLTVYILQKIGSFIRAKIFKPNTN